jgi:hypothetical protein
MGDSRGAVIAWSAGVSAAGAAIAVFFADGKPAWHRVVFAVLLMIAIAAFVVLLVAGMQGFVSWLRLSRARGRASGSTDAPASATPGGAPVPASHEVSTQENEASGHARLFGVQDGELTVHEDGPGQPTAPSAPRPAEQSAQHPARLQRNVARDNGEVFAVQDGNLHVHRLSAEGRETSEQPAESDDIADDQPGLPA